MKILNLFCELEIGDVPGSLLVGSMSMNGSMSGNGSDTGSMSVSGSVSGSMSASGKGDSSSGKLKLSQKIYGF